MDYVISFASSTEIACQAAIQTLVLPNLNIFFKHAERVHFDRGDAFDFIPPHERMMDYLIPQSALKSLVVTPCHWTVGINSVQMDNPSDLQLTGQESRALLAALAPYFESDGLVLTYDTPIRWMAQGGALFLKASQGILLASLDRVIGRNIDIWQPPTMENKSIRRLQNEIQMLLYTHPINDAREARGLPTVNSYWLSYQASTDRRFDFSLRDSALRNDWQSWAYLWQRLDAKLVSATQITLCGERHAMTYAVNKHPSMCQRFARLLNPKPNIHKVLQGL